MSISVVYLLAGDPQPFQRFLGAYDAYGAGIAHELIVLANRWTGPVSRASLETIRARGLRLMELSSIQFDLDAYWAAGKLLSSERICFLNSYTAPRGENWLRNLVNALNEPGVGIAGATGSYESHASFRMTAADPSSSASLSLNRVLRGLVNLVRSRYEYDPFPNPHIRTSAFAITRDLLMRLHVPTLETKTDAERVESGRQGLTRSIERLGYSAVVVGRDGVAYRKAQFRESHTFRVGQQCNLLISDNRTRLYQQADDRGRRFLRRISWGIEDDLRCASCGEE